MNRRYILLVIGLIAVSFLVGLYIDNIGLTGRTVVENKYAWTKAICNDNNECIDVVIECENGNVINIKPVSDLKRLELNWSDPRFEKEKLCE